MSISPSDASARRRALRALHASGCFVSPNPWDIGSARYLEGLGFKALASTSSGVAWSHGRPDGSFRLEETLAHVEELLAATTLPVNADFESGFASDAAGVARNVLKAIDAGVSALSLEDGTGIASDPLRPIGVGVERIRAARAAIDESGGETLLIGRAENFIVGVPDLADTINRLRAYSEVGADMLYAPGLVTPEQIRAVVAAVAPKPVNVLVGRDLGLTLDEIRALGVRRVSVGGALARVAWGGFMRAARKLAEEGRFDLLSDSASASELNQFFAR